MLFTLKKYVWDTPFWRDYDARSAMFRLNSVTELRFPFCVPNLLYFNAFSLFANLSRNALSFSVRPVYPQLTFPFVRFTPWKVEAPLIPTLRNCSSLEGCGAHKVGPTVLYSLISLLLHHVCTLPCPLFHSTLPSRTNFGEWISNDKEWEKNKPEENHEKLKSSKTKRNIRG